MTVAFDPTSVRKSLLVRASRDVAWRVFTAKIGSWWPLAHYKIGKGAAVDVVIEPHSGGSWHELGEDGSVCPWGRVLVWEPPARLVLTWDITADWVYDPSLGTEVEVRFVEHDDGTLVELEHRKLDRFGSRRDEMRRIFDTEGDWGKLLALFARRAEAEVN